MNLYNNLILVKGEDKTSDIKYCDYIDGKYRIVFTTGSNAYHYNYLNVRWMTKPIELNPLHYRIAKDGKVFYDVINLLQFEDYLRVFFKNGETRSYETRTLTIKKNSLANKKSASCLDYFKRLADTVSLVTDDGKKILLNQLEKISFVSEGTSLSSFLSGKLYEQKAQERKIYYPFGCNLSQMNAVKNALSNNISIIEGPPGTGKTQTILNIIANVIIDGKTVAVVSGNNSATANVAEKLQKYGFGFIVAALGNGDNKKEFIANQSTEYPSFDGYKYSAEEVARKKEDIFTLEAELENMLVLKNKLAELKKELNSTELQSKYFNIYLAETQKANIVLKIRKLSSSKLLSLWLEFDKYASTGKGFSVLFKYNQLLFNGIWDFSVYKNPASKIITTIQIRYYITKISELSAEIKTTEERLQAFNFNDKMNLLSSLSLDVLKDSLYKKYAGKNSRKVFSADDLWKNSTEFNNEYTVVLSTTYSIKSSLEKSYLFDYVIIDEASQVDLITGVLALSCAKNVVIVGDTKQLPNVISEQDKRRISPIIEDFSLAEGYEYTKNSLLSSVCSVLPSAPRTLLKEHYRCHPKIIEFCNMKFYNNELITMTQDNGETDVIKAYKTVSGNHARGHINQRQIDEIKYTILPSLTERFNTDEIGIIAPYRKQTEELSNDIATSELDVSTVHKFQGREKDAIIITTVDNEITEFTDNPNMLNVAVSRAKKSLHIVLSDNEKNENTNIGDLVKYIQYNNFEVANGEVYSVFDLLYKGLEEKRRKFLRKHKKISEYDSENLMYSLITQIIACDRFASLDVVCHQPLNMLIRDFKRLEADEARYVTNPSTHVDFVIYNKLDKMPVLVVEVDGYDYHKKGTTQHERDIIKNTVLEKYGIPFLRLSTTGSMEKEKIIKKLQAL